MVFVSMSILSNILVSFHYNRIAWAVSESTHQLIVEPRLCELESGFRRSIAFPLIGTIIDIRNCHCGKILILN